MGLNVIAMPGTDEWRTSAACLDTAPDLFFPVGTTGPALDQIAAAKRVCDGCLVQRECLEYSLITNQDSGVWGGASEEERRLIRKQRRRAAAAARTA